MKTPLLYIFESIACSGIFFLLYRILIFKYTSFKINRFFLLSGIILSCLIPLMQIPVWKGDVLIIPHIEIEETQTLSMKSIVSTNDNGVEILNQILTGIYILGFIVGVYSFVKSIYETNKIRRQSTRVKYDRYVLAYNDLIDSPFSFLNTIYLPAIDNEREKEQIIIHECSHILHNHTHERLLLELLRLICWFNPFVWMSMKKLVEIHEMEADRDVLNSGYDVTEYRISLLKQVFGVKEDIACSLTGNTLKERFLEMTRNRKVQNIRVILLIPFLLLSIIIFVFVKKPNEIKYVSNSKENVVRTALVDVCNVTGKVTDKITGNPMVGAAVVDIITKAGVVTDSEGAFTLDVNKGSNIEIIYPNYNKAIIMVGNDNTLKVNIEMEPSSISSEKILNNKENQPYSLIIVDGKPYNGSMSDIPNEKIKECTIIKNVDHLKPYIEEYGEVAHNGVIKIVLNK